MEDKSKAKAVSLAWTKRSDINFSRFYHNDLGSKTEKAETKGSPFSSFVILKLLYFYLLSLFLFTEVNVWLELLLMWE